MALGINGQSAPVAQSDVYDGPPGEPFAGNDFAMDYVLLKVGAVDPALALEPDPRELAQPGERVTLFSGLGDRQGGADPRMGTVLSAEPAGIVILMDQTDFNPAGMSGSPVVSQYTGRVVGMAIGAALFHTRWEIGLHPIRHLVKAAEAAREFPRISDFRR